jgi:hypothetical protein
VIDGGRRAAELLDDAVSHYRNRGHTRATALGMAAKALGVTLRRAKGLVYGEPVAIDKDELDAIRAAFLDHLDEEAETLSQRLQDIRERRQRMSSL